jgi:hypothetical protein
VRVGSGNYRRDFCACSDWLIIPDKACALALRFVQMSHLRTTLNISTGEEIL